MKIFNRLLIILISLQLGAFAQASSLREAGTSGAAILSEITHGRIAGMGRAFTAVPDDVTSLYSNPAGLGRTQYMEVTASHRQLVESVKRSDVGLVYPLKQGSSGNVRNLGTIGLTAGILDYGRFDGRDAAGNPTFAFKADDRVFGLSYGKEIFPRMTIGLSGKYYVMTIQESRETGASFDAGLIYRAKSRRWSLGLSTLNLGDKVRFDSQSDSLPQTWNAGIAIYPIEDWFTLSADLVNNEDDDSEIRTGLEWWVVNFFALRAGYDSGYDLGGGITFGAGFQILDVEYAFLPARRILLDYSFAPSGETTDEGSNSLQGIHQVSISVQFGEDDHDAR